VVNDVDAFQDFFRITDGKLTRKRPALRRCLKYFNGKDRCEFHLKFSYKLNQAPPISGACFGCFCCSPVLLGLVWAFLCFGLPRPGLVLAGLSCLVFGLPCTGGLVRALGALGPVISKDFVYISKIFKDDRELTPEEMSTMVDVRAEGCGAPCRWFLQQF
jgi:hypothetical protein